MVLLLGFEGKKMIVFQSFARYVPVGSHVLAKAGYAVAAVLGPADDGGQQRLARKAAMWQDWAEKLTSFVVAVDVQVQQQQLEMTMES